MILIALGANLSSRVGAPNETLHAALMELSRSGVNLKQLSSIYRTPAWPDSNDPPFANAVASVETVLSPQELLARLHETETSFGRTRSTRNAPRTLDLDLIDYRGQVELGPPLLPHPRLQIRNFVLIPLRDIAPGWRHPESDATVEDMIAALPEGERILPLW